MLSSLKIYGLMFVAGLLAFLVGALKYMERQRDRYKVKAEHAQAEIRFRKGADEAETEVESEHSDLKRQLEQDKTAGKWPENLRK